VCRLRKRWPADLVQCGERVRGGATSTHPVPFREDWELYENDAQSAAAGMTLKPQQESL
jgi:hypothetical protein